MEKIDVELFYDHARNEETGEDESIGIYTKEWDLIRKRREILGLDEHPQMKVVEANIPDKAPFDIFAIALSGGGIRSATFNLGFLKGLNHTKKSGESKKSLFRQADYLSTVSGGGYIGSFIQHRLHQTREYDNLFNDDELKYLREHGDYLRMGAWGKIVEKLNFYLNTLILTMLHLIWYILFFISILILIFGLGQIFPDIPAKAENYGVVLLSVSLLWYYFLSAFRNAKPRIWSAKKLFYINTAIIIFLTAALFSNLSLEYLCSCFKEYDDFKIIILLALFLFTIGLFANPNILSSHRFYRFRLKDAFLEGSNINLHDLVIEDDDGAKYTCAPYPLINTTLNLQNDKSISGKESCDYYLLSPLYCGSKLTGYIPAYKGEYSRMTLATAMTISGAALNPNMGYKSNRVMAFFMTLFNLRLGYWALNPKIFWSIFHNNEPGLISLYHNYIQKFAVWSAKKLKYAITLWPYYNIAELLGTLNSKRIRINLSDGGNIENLAVFELLRRKCSLIIASDAGADPDFTFADLKILQIRARNELELSIEFPDTQDPEKFIRPNSKTGQSQRHYAVAEIYELGKEPEERKVIGYFVYVKASITAQKRKLPEEMRKEPFYSYKNYHPSFPHESTVDQFFDATQWEAYEKLGEAIAKDLFSDFDAELNIKNLKEYFRDKIAN